MGKFDGRTSRLFYDIKAIQKEQNLTSVIGQAIVTIIPKKSGISRLKQFLTM